MHGELLGLARSLAEQATDSPAQAAMRRAVSTAYYAAFHWLVCEATERMFGAGDDRAALRACLARGFAHRTMRNVAAAFAEGHAPAKLAPALAGRKPQPELARVARALYVLQQARETADYDTAYRFEPDRAIEYVEMAEQAFEDWAAVRGSVQADAFLAGLFALGALRA